MSKELELETDHVDYRIVKKKAPVGEEKVINDHIADKETADKIFAGVVKLVKFIYNDDLLESPTENKIVVHLEEVTRLFEPGVSKIIYRLEENEVKTEVKKENPEKTGGAYGPDEEGDPKNLTPPESGSAEQNSDQEST